MDTIQVVGVQKFLLVLVVLLCKDHRMLGILAARPADRRTINASWHGPASILPGNTSNSNTMIGIALVAAAMVTVTVDALA